jgi:hypothetical protein
MQNLQLGSLIAAGAIAVGAMITLTPGAAEAQPPINTVTGQCRAMGGDWDVDLRLLQRRGNLPRFNFAP